MVCAVHHTLELSPKSLYRFRVLAPDCKLLLTMVYNLPNIPVIVQIAVDIGFIRVNHGAKFNHWQFRLVTLYIFI